MQDTQPANNEKGDQDLNVAFALGEVSGKLGVFMTTMGERFDTLSVNLAAARTDADVKWGDLDKRIQNIEKWHTKMTAIGSLGGVALGWLMEWIIHHV